MTVKSVKYGVVVLFGLLLSVYSGGALSASPPMSDQAILTAMKERLEDRNGVGMVVGLIDESGPRVLAAGMTRRSAGEPVDGATVFEIGSLTKLFTAVILADMVEKGEVNLSDPVEKFLPSSVKVPARGERKITLLDLATHTSGLPRMPTNVPPEEKASPYAAYSVERLYAFLSNYQLPRDIGAREEYSNVGMGLLGHVLSLRAGTSFEKLVQTRITGTLGMDRTRIVLTPEMQARRASGYDGAGAATPALEMQVLEGAGALHSSANDMLKFLAANMGTTSTPLYPALEATHHGMHPATSAPRLAWGLSKKYGSSIYVHSGETFGFKSFIAFDPAARRGVVIMANSLIEVADLAHKIINSQYRMLQFVPPRQFARAMEDAGYKHSSALYEQFKQRDSDFFLTEEVANQWGYDLLAKGRPQAALEVLRLGVYMRPGSANAHDSLAEVYEKTGEKGLARTHYQRSLELDPGNTHAVERLHALNGE